MDAERDRFREEAIDMNQQEFEELLRFFLRREPFQPFVVELLDGRMIEVDQPRVGFNGGAAGYVNASEELVFFECEEVRAIRALAHELAS